jgi:hypothetical protein
LGEHRSRTTTSRFSVRNSTLIHPHFFRCSSSGSIPQISSLMPLFQRYAINGFIDYLSFQQIHAVLIALPLASSGFAHHDQIDTNHFMSTALFQASDITRRGLLSLHEWLTGLVLLGYTWSNLVTQKLRLLFDSFRSGPDSLTTADLRQCLQTCLHICYQTDLSGLLPDVGANLPPALSYSFAEFCKVIEENQVIMDNIYGVRDEDSESSSDSEEGLDG